MTERLRTIIKILKEQKLLLGERGGEFHINRHGNRIYVKTNKK